MALCRIIITLNEMMVQHNFAMKAVVVVVMYIDGSAHSSGCLVNDSNAWLPFEL